MKAISALLACVVFTGLVVVLSATKVEVANAHCSGAGDDYVNWDGENYPNWIHSVSGTPYTFTTTQGFHWCYATAPTNGGVTFIGGSSTNVANLQYDPEYFFPDSVGNAYTLEIEMSGEHPTPTSTAHWTTDGWCWSPYAHSNRRVDIFAH